MLFRNIYKKLFESKGFFFADGMGVGVEGMGRVKLRIYNEGAFATGGMDALSNSAWVRLYCPHPLPPKGEEEFKTRSTAPLSPP